MSITYRNVLAGAAGQTTGSDSDAYQIEKSLRFNEADSAYLTRELSGESNRRTWTWAGWVKRADLGEDIYLWAARDGSSQPNGGFRIKSDGSFYWLDQDASTNYILLTSTPLHRDPSAWYHFVVVVDTTSSVESERVKVYTNGVQIAVTGSYPSQNFETTTNKSIEHTINRRTKNNGDYEYGDGYFADVHFIDGLALSPGAFGSFDSTGVWNPKAFALPAPNKGVTHSSTLTSSSGWNYGAPADAFDGVATSTKSVNPTSGHTATWKPATEIKGQLFEIYCKVEDQSATDHLTVNGVSYFTDVYDQLGNNTFGWATLNGLRSINTTQGLTFKRTDGNKQCAISAIRVDGVILVDGQTDPTTRTNPNDGTKWSDQTSGGAENGSYPMENVFDGNNGLVGARAISGGGLVFEPTGGIPYTSTVRIHSGTTGAGDQTVSINDGTGFTFTDDEWVTVLSGSGTLSKIAVTASALGNSNAYLTGIEIDGHVLLDSAVDNSFHLKFNDTSLNRYLGKDTLNGKIADATGGLPIYKTKAGSTDNEIDYGDVKDTGNRTDSDSSDLKIALPLYNNLDDESGNNRDGTITGTTVAVTDQSRFYGGCYYFPGTGNASSYISIADCDELDFQGAWTIEYWVRFKRAPGTQDSPCASATDYKRPGMFRLISGEMGYFSSSNGSSWDQVIGDGAATGKGTQVLAKDTWYHIAFQYDGSSKFTAYVNGTLDLDYTTSVTGNAYNASEAYTLGRWGTAYGFQGWLQDFRIYGKVKYSSAFKPPTRNDFTVNNLTEAAPDPGKMTRIRAKTTWGQHYIGQIKLDGTAVTGATLDDSAGQWTDDDKFQNGSTGSGNETYNQSAANEWFDVTLSSSDNYTGSDVQIHMLIDTAAGAPAGNVYEVEVFFNDGTSKLKTYANYDDDPSGFTHGFNTRGWQDFGAFKTDPSELDSLTDTPTNYGTDTGAGGEVRGNYATLNSLKTGSGITLAQGNLYGSSSANSWKNSQSTIGMNSGKWYVEFGPGLNQDSNNNICAPSVCLSTHVATTNISGAGSTNLWYNGALDMNGSQTGSWASTYGTTEVIGCALDADTGKVWWSINGTWQASGNPATGANPAGTLTNTNNESFVFAANLHGSSYVHMNFGARPFKYTAPTGFKALCTQNLDDTFSGAELNNPSKYFDIKKYGGTGASQDIKGVGFQPDLVWIKNLESLYDHAVFDAARGANKRLRPSGTHAEGTDTQTLTSFNADGFTTGTDNVTNKSGDDVVAFMWDAGTAAVSASDEGSITPTAQWKNTTAGFSISAYTGTGSAATIGHGLGAKPEFIIIKSRDAQSSNQSWTVHHKDVAIANTLILNDSDPAGASGSWNSTAPTNTVFSIGTVEVVNTDEKDYIAYCWRSIPGFSKFGGYDANNSADGNFIYLGFEPSWLMIKRTNGDNNWIMKDTTRYSYNPQEATLLADGTNVESDFGIDIDFLSNGFKLRATDNNVNTSGSTHIYAAFAKHPFKTSRAR